jgi:cellulose biosynthesis protein BcsQ
MKIIAFFNNKGGVGKTSLCYHIAWMFSELGHKTLTVDLDPQSNFSSMCIDEDAFYDLLIENKTIVNALKPLTKGIGDVQKPHIECINENLYTILGDLELSSYEDTLSFNWLRCLDRDEAAFRFVSAFYRIIKKAGNSINAEYCFIDLGSNLGALNRMSLISADHIIIPLTADLFSLQGMKNLGKSLLNWQNEWKDRLSRTPPNLDFELPEGKMNILGYIVSQHGAKENRPVKAYNNWANQIPNVYRNAILTSKNEEIPINPKDDPYCIGFLKHFRSIMPMAMAAHKPMFLLKPADGAIGAHYQAVQVIYSEYKIIAEGIIDRIEAQKESQRRSKD